jgi:hypothetical protein
MQRMFGRKYVILLSFAALAFGILSAWAYQWLCDDAFITFRYAEHFVSGHGLVFNEGERVEGYTNFLWTIWIALAIFLHFNPETWAILWGIAFYAASLILLLFHDINLQGDQPKGMFFPVAVVFSAFNPDWQIYATSGLETSLLTFLLVASFMMLFAKKPSCLLAGFFAGLATMTRQDAFLFFLASFLTLLIFRRNERRQMIQFTLAYSVPVILFFFWRFWYYSEIFPNTYYAKSANIAWYSQGFFYVRLYFQKYWIFAAGLVFVLFSTLRKGRERFGDEMWSSRILPETAIAAGFCAAYMLYVARVGGDFMFARMLIPLTPFFAIALEIALLPYLPRRPLFSALLIGTLLIAFVYQARLMSGLGGIRGIVNEWYYYERFKPDWNTEPRRQARILEKYFRGLNVRIGYFGGEARMLFYMPDLEAIECETGLTDYFIAHLPLTKRGRIGHEKKPPIDYVVNQRQAHFVFAQHAAEALQLDQKIPRVTIQFNGIEGRVLFWDSTLMQELKNRGAMVPNFLELLDQYIENMPQKSEERVRREYKLLKRFYFQHENDPKREDAFQCKLNLKSCKSISLKQ